MSYDLCGCDGIQCCPRCRLVNPDPFYRANPPMPGATMPAGYRYDEFGHLLVAASAQVVGTYWAHVHEGQALSCSWYEANGWPQS